MNERHVIVIGGGVIGVCTALWLARGGAKVTLLEEKELAAGASFGNAGLISLGHPPLPRPGLVLKSLKWMFDPTSPLLIVPRLDPALWTWLVRFARACSRKQFDRSMKLIAALSHASRGLFEELAEREGLEFELRRTGYMDVYRTPAGFERAAEEARLIRSHGIDERIISAEEAREREPALREGLAGAIWHNDGGFASPASFVTQAAARAAHYGATIRTRTSVARMLTQDDDVIGVRTLSGEEIRADTVVIAAGIWSSRLARTAGIHVPMQGAKGYHVHVPQLEPRMRVACNLGESFVVATPIEGQIRLAGTLELSGVNHNLRPERVAMLTKQASDFVPGLRGLPVLSTWCGLRPCTADGLPVIGWAPRTRGLYIATGHAMMGFWLAPVTGKIASEEILGRGCEIDLAAARPARFA